MSGITTITVTPAAAAEAYSRTERGGASSGTAADFGTTLQRALTGAVATAQDAEIKAANAVEGRGQSHRSRDRHFPC
jgi:hypothetical protein